jgi:hypothetical protein
MSKNKKDIINVQGTEIILLSHRKEDCISLTDMAKYRDINGFVMTHGRRIENILTKRLHCHINKES